MSLLSRSQIIQPNNNQFNQGWVSLPGGVGLVGQVSNMINSGLALNAMPTPFARAEVVREAFEAIGNNFNNAGRTYQNIVSDTLDVLEILFNYDLYKDNIRVYQRDLSTLNIPSSTKVVNGKQVPVKYLENALLQYCAKDAQDNPIYTVYVVTYLQGTNEYAIAMSWPDTLFFTSSRMDRTIKVDGSNQMKNEYRITIPRKGQVGQDFFDLPVDLKNRDQRFQDYMYHLYVNNLNTFGKTALGQFIANTFGSRRVNNFDSSTVVPIKDSNLGNSVVLPLRNGQLALDQDNVPQTNAIFNNEVVSVGYSINSNRFVTMSGNGNDSCLLPLNMDAFTRLNDTSFVNAMTFTGLAIQANNYSLPAKRYNGPMHPFDVGIYPFFKYPAGCIQNNVATYHIVLSYEINAITQQNDDVCLQFYHANGSPLTMCTRDVYQDPQSGVNQCVVKETRTKLIQDGKTLFTVHYTVIGTDFDYIQVDIKTANGVKSGVLKPKFDIPTQADGQKIKFAVDFGTTSTFIAVREGQNNPTSLTTNEESMVYLHCGEASNQSAVYKHERYGGLAGAYASCIPELVKLIKNEFAPSSIDGEAYKFPIRTAVSYKQQGAIEDIFEDGNIAFTYDKETCVGVNLYKTNIKWAIRNNALSSVYIREIVRMCIIHAISKSYQMQNVEFLYFYPLAMNTDTQRAIRRVWQDVCQEFGINPSQISEMTESLAPYYVTNKADARCVASIDIGGGSVDTVVYNDGVPKFAMSSLFGCDTLWGNGRDAVANSKDNPIYKNLIDTIRPKLQDELRNINDVMAEDGSDYTSSDIINFWLSNNNITKVADELSLSAYHPVYVAHFYAIVYHLAQSMSKKELAAPVEISLSGNGSLYLGYLKKEDLSIIATTAFKDAYDKNVNAIKVTLPSEVGYKGKEMAAYGGLKVGAAIPQVEPYIYLGGDAEIDTSHVDGIMNDGVLNENVAISIANNICQMEKNLEALLKELKMPMNIASNADVHRTTLIKAAQDEKYVNAQGIVSTLFFAPAQQLIFDIESKLNFQD